MKGKERWRGKATYSLYSCRAVLVQMHRRAYAACSKMHTSSYEAPKRFLAELPEDQSGQVSQEIQ